MAHIGKEKIDEKVFNSLFAQLTSVLGDISKAEVDSFLTNLLTPVEKVMLTKRFTAVIMFEAGYSSYAIEQTVKISSSTAVRLRSEYREGRYDELLRVLAKNKRRKEEFWEAAEKLLRLGMPSMGKDRWKHIL